MTSPWLFLGALLAAALLMSCGQAQSSEDGDAAGKASGGASTGGASTGGTSASGAPAEGGGATPSGCDPPQFEDAALDGNPLDPRSVNEVVPALCERGYRVSTDDGGCGARP